MVDSDKNDLQERLFQFAVNIILLIRKLPKGNPISGWPEMNDESL
jgi:hypothetical protein